jgi:predicted membrane channel-forming protein YqfA (hemolysin III family)
MFAEPQNKNISQLQSPQSQSPHIQPKLEVGAKDDPQEKEADAVAESVMRMSESSGASGDSTAVKTQQESPVARLLRRHSGMPGPQVIHRYADAPKAPSIQRAPASLQGPASPVIRKKEEEEVMRDHDPAEEEKVMKMDDEEGVQKKEDEENVMMKEDEEGVMKKEDEENVMKMDDGGKGGTAPAAVEQGIQSSKGQGNPLPQNVQQDIGPKMGADLSDVRVHTGSNAHEMSTAINAKAFTHGQDVYFKNGNYDTSSSSGKSLLTHELAHTQQQKGGVERKIQRQYGGDTLTADDKKFLKDNFDVVTDVMPLADQKKLAKGLKVIRENIIKNPPQFYSGATSNTFKYSWQEGDTTIEITKTFDRFKNPESATFSYKSPTFRVTSKKQIAAQSPVNNSGGNQQPLLYQSGTTSLDGIEAPHFQPADEVYRVRDNYPDISETPYKNPAVGTAYDQNHRSEVMDNYVMDLRHDDRPAKKYQKAYVYRRDLYIELEDGRTVHIKVDGETHNVNAKATGDTVGNQTEVDIVVEVYGGEGERVEIRDYYRGNGSVNSGIYNLALKNKVPAGLLKDGKVDALFMKNAKDYADRVMDPIEESLLEEWFGEDKEEEQENKESGEAKPFEEMTKDEKKSKAWRDVWRKTSARDIVINGIVAIIGMVILAIIAVLFGWEAALIVGVLALIIGFCMEFFNAKDDEEKINIVVRYILYILLAIASIFAIPALVAGGFTLLAASLIVGTVAAVVLAVVGFIFLVRRINRASEAKTPEEFEHETDQGSDIVETSIVEIIISILSGFLPPLGERVPPSWRDKWNPFKHKPLVPPIDPPGQKGGQQGGNKPITPPTNKAKTAKTAKTPKRAKPVYTVTTKQGLTWSEFVNYKSKGFIIDTPKTNSQKLTLVNKLTNEIIEVTLNQGGPSWIKPNWSRNRLIKELQTRGFMLDKSTKGPGGVLYKNKTTGEEFRVMPKPRKPFVDDPVEKHLNDYYYRYRPNSNTSEGAHTTIPN